MKKKLVKTILLTLLCCLFVMQMLPASAANLDSDSNINTTDSIVTKDVDTGELTYTPKDKLPTFEETEAPASEPISNDPFSLISPRIIIGSDNRTPANPILSSVAYITSYWPNGTQTNGTAFFIAEKALLTAAHCLYDPLSGGWATSVRIYPGKNGTSNPFGYYSSAYFTIDSEYIPSGSTSAGVNAAFDWGVIDINTSTSTGYFGFSTTLTTSSKISTNGYPGDKGQVQYYESGNKVKNVYSEYFSHELDIINGHSGSPIYTVNTTGNRIAVGLQSSHSPTENFACKIDNHLYSVLNTRRLNPDRKFYTVKYNANGGTGTMANTQIEYNVGGALRSNTFTKTASHFVGWQAHRQSDNKWYYKSADGSNTGWYLSGTQPSGWVRYVYGNNNVISNTTSVNNDIVTMYAQWKTNTFTFKYNANGGAGTMANTVVTYGTSTALRKNAFTKAGNTFLYWHLQKDGKWHYTPGGWYAEGSQPAGATKSIYTDQQSVSKTTSENNGIITAYAQWKPNTFTISYNANGGSGTMASTVVTYGTSTALRKNAFTKTGSTFKYWNLQKDGKWHYTPGGWYAEGSQPAGATKSIYSDQQMVSKTTSENNGKITAYAQWDIVYYLYGDVNGDGNITIGDATLIQKYLIDEVTLTPAQLKRADVNNDGKVSIKDASCIQKYLISEEHNSRTGERVY